MQKCTFCRAFAPQPSYVAPQRTPLQQPPRVSLHIQVKKAAPCAAPRGPAEPPGGPPLHGRGWLHQAHPRERPSGPPAPGPHTFTTKPQRTLRPSRPRLDDAAQGPTDTLAQVSVPSSGVASPYSSFMRYAIPVALALVALVAAALIGSLHLSTAGNYPDCLHLSLVSPSCHAPSRGTWQIPLALAIAAIGLGAAVAVWKRA